jgi:hypothetical protein
MCESHHTVYAPLAYLDVSVMPVGGDGRHGRHGQQHRQTKENNRIQPHPDVVHGQR